MSRALVLFATIQCFMLHASAAEWVLQGPLVPSDGTVNDGFGHSAGISGNTAIIAALPLNGGRTASSSAYIYVLGSAGWVEQAKINPPAGVRGFGLSAAISGDTAVIGISKGAIIFVRTGGAWVEQARLASPDPSSDIAFGQVVSISGNTVLVTDAYRNNGAGAAFVYTRTGTTWMYQATLQSLDLNANDVFGISAALEGDTALIGAAFDNNTTGSAYVFERDGTSWHQAAKLEASPGPTSGFFGSTVALSANTAIVGSSGGLKAAFVYVRGDSGWMEQAKLAPADQSQFTWFGYTVAIHGDRAVVAALKSISDESLYHYMRRGTEWTLEAVSQEPSATAGDLFAGALAIQGQTVLASTIGTDIQGRVYVYETACSASVNLTYVNNTLGIGYSIRTSEPVSWGGWLITAGGVRPLWQTGLPEIPTPHTGSFSIPGFPASGTIGVLSNMATTAGSQCTDLEVINTGGGVTLSAGQLKAIADKALGKQP